MEKVKSANLIVMLIGAIALIMGVIQLFIGDGFENQLFLLFIGISLIGTGWIQFQELKKTDDQNDTVRLN